MEEYYMPVEMLDAGSEFHESGHEIYLTHDEFVHGTSEGKLKRKFSLATARKMFYLLAGSATIASIGFLSK